MLNGQQHPRSLGLIFKAGEPVVWTKLADMPST
jgi:hypothetical protein